MITYDLNGKTALVTGSNRGIGKAMADALEEAGAKVIRTISPTARRSMRSSSASRRSIKSTFSSTMRGRFSGSLRRSIQTSTGTR